MATRFSSPQLLDTRQLDAVNAWVGTRHELLPAMAAAPSADQEHGRGQLAAALDQAHRALQSQTRIQLAQCLEPRSQCRRALVVHRNPWFVDMLTGSLAQQGITVIAAADSGANALGMAVAEQPDAVFAGHRLPDLTAPELFRFLRRYAPHTMLVGQAIDGRGTDELRRAGADVTVGALFRFSDVARQVAEVLDGPRFGSSQLSATAAEPTGRLLDSPA